MSRTRCSRHPASLTVSVRRTPAAMRPVALRRLAWLVPLCALIGPTGAADAVTPAQTCAAAKLKAAGTEVGGKMGCYAKAKKAGVAVDGDCLSTQRMKSDTRINTWPTGACSGTAEAIDAAVDNFVAAFLNDDPGNGACPAASASKIGRGGKVELGCQAKDVLRPGMFAACDEKKNGKTGAGLAKAGGCVNPTAVLADIDNCDTAIDAIIQTTTTTTTTIPPPSCSSSSRGSPCDASCPNSVCAPESPHGCTPSQHRGPGDACVDRGSCSDFGTCGSDSGCSTGKICILGFPNGDPFGGCATACCSPCSSYSCLISRRPRAAARAPADISAVRRLVGLL